MPHSCGCCFELGKTDLGVQAIVRVAASNLETLQQQKITVTSIEV